MKNKSTIVAIIIMLIAICIGFGIESINNLSATNRLAKMINSDINLQSIRMDVDGTVNFDMPEDVNNLSPMLSENIILKGYSESIYDPNNFQVLVNESMNMSGMTFEFSTLLNHDELYIKYPILGKPLYVSLDDIKNASKMDFPKEWLPKLYSIILDINMKSIKSFIENINPEHIVYGDDMLYEQNGYSQTLKTIEITLDNDDIIKIIKNLFVDIINDKNLNEFANEIINYYTTENTEIAGIQNRIEKAKEEINKFINDDSQETTNFYMLLNQILEKAQIKTTLGVNNMNIPLFVNTNMNFTIIDPDTKMEFSIKYDINQKLSKINEIVSIDKSEFKKDKCISIVDFINQFN